MFHLLGRLLHIGPAKQKPLIITRVTHEGMWAEYWNNGGQVPGFTAEISPQPNELFKICLIAFFIVLVLFLCTFPA